MKLKYKYICICLEMMVLLTVGAVQIITTNSAEDLFTQRTISREWEQITIREGPDLIDIRCEPRIDSLAQLLAYQTAHLELLYDLSEQLDPDDEVGAVVTLSYPLSRREASALAQTRRIEKFNWQAINIDPFRYIVASSPRHRCNQGTVSFHEAVEEK